MPSRVLSKQDRQPGEALSRRLHNRKSVEERLQEHRDLIRRIPDEREWLCDRRWEGKMCLAALSDFSAVVHESIRTPEEASPPARFERLTDAGKLHNLRLHAMQLGAEIETYLRSVHSHPALREEVVRIRPLLIPGEMSGSERSRHLQVRWMLTQEEADLIRLEGDLRRLLRRIVYYLRQSASMEHQIQVAERMDRMISQRDKR